MHKHAKVSISFRACSKRPILTPFQQKDVLTKMLAFCFRKQFVFSLVLCLNYTFGTSLNQAYNLLLVH